MRIPSALDPAHRPFVGGLTLGLAHALTFSLAFPPFNLWPLVFVTMIPLILVALRTTNPRRSAIAVLLACLPAQAFLHVWVYEITSMGMPLLAVYMSLYPSLYVRLMAFIRDRTMPAIMLLAAVMFWPAMEFFRGEIFAQGYPWYMLADPLPFKTQNGIYVSGWYIVMGSACMFLAGPLNRLLTQQSNKRWLAACHVIMLAGFVFLGLTIGLGDEPDATRENPPTLRIAIIQTNVPQSNKQAGTIEDRMADFLEAINLSREAAGADPPPDLIVWPETMVPVFWGLNESSYIAERDSQISVPIETPDGPRRLPTYSVRERLVELQQELGIPMLVGAISVTGLEFTTDAAGSISISSDARYNSAFLLDDGDVVNERYNKMKLTPFGEIMPGISSWPWLEQQLLDLGARGMSFDLASGSQRTVFSVQNTDGTPFRIVTPICFEITYAATCRSLVFDGNERRADIMLNITNDGWFGDWDPGREVHNTSAKWRAAELATPVVRAANTGYSTHIDEFGREIARLGANEPGVLVVEVLKGRESTMFSFLGFIPHWLLLAASVALLAFAWFRGRGAPRGDNSQGGGEPIADKTS